MAKQRTPAQLDREIAEFTANPKLGDPTWEREWADLLAEKHAKARLPTLAELAHAYSYIEREYVISDGRIDAEQWAEGLVFGQRSSVDTSDKRHAEDAFGQLSVGKWLRIAERANYLAREQGETPRYTRS